MSNVHLISKPGVVMERVTDVIAAFGLATWITPSVFDWIQSFNETIAVVIPPVSLLWLLTQLWKYWVRGK